MPKVSVLLTNYNGEKHLDEAISSVLAQTYTDFEFIIIDDASTDSSKAIIDSIRMSGFKHIMPIRIAILPIRSIRLL